MNKDLITKSHSSNIFKNFGYLTIGKILGDIFTFSLFVVLTRIYGQEGIGQYSFAMALTSFFSTFTDFGLYHLSIKDISRKQKNFSDYLGTLIFSRILLTIAASIALVLMVFILDFSEELEKIILIIGAYQIIYSLGSGLLAIFIAKEKMFITAIFEFTLKTIIAVIGISLALLGFDLNLAILIFPIATLIYVLICMITIVKLYHKPDFTGSIQQSYQLIRKAVSYAFMLFLHQVSTRLDVVFLGFILGVAAAGIYNTAYRIIFMFLIITSFASMALLPVMSKLYIDSKDELIKLYNQSLNIVTLIGVPIAIGTWLIAPNLIVLLYGDGFEESILILKLLSLLLFFSCIHQIIGTALTASDKQNDRTKCQWTTAVINIIGNAMLIPLLGIKGAAIATLISEGALVIMLIFKAMPVLGWPNITSRLLISIIGSIAFCIPILFYEVTSIPIIIIVSILIYYLILFTFKEIRDHELDTINRLIKPIFKNNNA